MTRQRAWALLWLGSAVVALLVLASGLATLRFRPGHLYDLGAPPAATGAPGQVAVAQWVPPPWLGVVVTLIVLALLLATVVNLILSREFRREMFIRVISMLLAVLIFYLLIAALRGNTLQGDRAPIQTGAPPPPLPPAGEPFPTFVANPAPWLVIAISVVLAALLLGGIWLLWRRMRPRPDPLARLADEARAALADLEAGENLTDTVLRCYVEMSRVLSQQRGLDRPRDMTPREFERQLAAAGLRDEHIQQLTRLFERVRYGARQPNEREERAAVACLTAIVQTYGSAP